jgi:hypothetical protein
MTLGGRRESDGGIALDFSARLSLASALKVGRVVG